MFRLSAQVEWALHCCVVLSRVADGQALPASRLAELHGVPLPYLAKALQAMSRSAIVEAVPGRNGGYRLARDPAAISFLEIIDAIEGRATTFVCTEIRRRLPPGGQRPMPVCAIAAAMYRAEESWRTELAATTLADIRTQLQPHPSAPHEPTPHAWTLP